MDYIVVEGLDRSGKSTQAATLTHRLNDAGHTAKLVKFPDRTTSIGKMINAYLQSQTDLDDHVIHLLFSANRWELATQLESDLNSGITIVCDRYAFSGCAFSAAKGLSYEWCWSPDIGLPAPDLVLFLDVSPQVAKSRGGYGDERYEKEELQNRVREMFHKLGKSYGPRWHVVDADPTPEEVEKCVWTAVEPLVGKPHEALTRLQ